MCLVARGKHCEEDGWRRGCFGSLIGALAGGGKGAAIGAGVGGGVGTGSETITKGDQVKAPSETLIDFTLQQEVSIPMRSN